MNTLDERAQINNLLGKMGLAQLGNLDLLVQIGFLIADHEQLRELLVRQKPEQRKNMYECLRGHLRFQPKPLDVYLSEAGNNAERRQLPTLEEDGSLREFRVSEIGEKAIHADMAWEKNHRLLTVTCSYCTFVQQFTGNTPVDAVVNARKEGWLYAKVDDKEFETCPKCAKKRAN